MEIFDILRFEVSKTVNLPMTDVFSEIGNVILTGAVDGTYEYGFSTTFNFDQANKAEFMRFSLDDGLTWTEFSTSVGNSAVDTPVLYSFFKENVSGDLTMKLEMRKEDATGIMTVKFSDTWIRRIN